LLNKEQEDDPPVGGRNKDSTLPAGRQGSNAAGLKSELMNVHPLILLLSQTTLMLFTFHH
jgi:hypothetical protein